MRARETSKDMPDEMDKVATTAAAAQGTEEARPAPPAGGTEKLGPPPRTQGVFI